MSSKAMKLMGSFDPRGYDDWVGVATKALKTTPFDKLKSTTADGIPIEPIYEGNPTPQPIGARAAGTPWTVTARVDIPGNKTANAQILDDLVGGASGLDLVCAESPNAYGFGLTISCDGCVKTLTAGVHLDLIPIRIDAGHRSADVARLFLGVAAEQGKSVDLAVIQDPIGLLAATGRLGAKAEDAIAAAAEAAKDFPGAALEADGRVWHAAGASEAQELAALLSTGVAYLRALEAAGFDLEAAAAKIGFTAVADQNQFRSIAKLRALPLLWGRVLEACGLAAVAPRVHVETARRMMAKRDAFTNLLRTTIATFAAGVAGASSVTVLPFTQGLGLPDAFARRIARNTQSILIEESNLHRVADPAAGSGLVDEETEALAERAWALFQAIEAEGGMVAALRSGSFHAKVAVTAKSRIEAIAKRREAVTGVSEFPNLAEAPIAVMDTAAPTPKSFAPVEHVAAFTPRPLAETFEGLRDRSDAAGTRPKIFLANLGRIADFTARSTWAKNFFEAGGIEAITSDGFASIEALSCAYKASGALAAVICSSDAVYDEQAVAAATALADAGCEILYLAGKPADAEKKASYEGAGVTGFVHVGVDVAATLSDALDRLGA
ncbi:MAG: methylmalonyl-CoA mutase subunit beta [Hyphomicrobiales bacterium]|nr:methylmalonyl-CoA mutase subunit beta [Hyphomicrobiales bacterium]